MKYAKSEGQDKSGTNRVYTSKEILDKFENIEKSIANMLYLEPNKVLYEENMKNLMRYTQNYSFKNFGKNKYDKGAYVKGNDLLKACAKYASMNGFVDKTLEIFKKYDGEEITGYGFFKKMIDKHNLDQKPAEAPAAPNTHERKSSLESRLDETEETPKPFKNPITEQLPVEPPTTSPHSPDSEEQKPL